QPGQVLLDGLDHRHGVRARLTPHLEDHRGDAVHADGRALLLRAVLRPADVTQAHRGAIDRGDHEVVERPRIDHAAHGADRLLLPPGGDVAPGKVRVLPDDGVADGGDRNLVGGEAIGLDPDVDGPQEPADQPYLADPERALEVDLHRLVGDLGQLAKAPVTGDGQCQDRRLVVVQLGDGRGPDVVGQVPDRVRHLLADVLSRDVNGPAEGEGDRDVARAGAGERPELGDALDGVDGLFDLLGDL